MNMFEGGKLKGQSTPKVVAATPSIKQHHCNMLIDFYAAYVLLLHHPFLSYLLRHYYAVFLYCLVLDLEVSCLIVN